MILREPLVYQMSKDNKAAMTIKSGDTISVETKDCFCNQIVSEAQSIDALDWSKTNPATGPIYVSEAEPGDILKIRIESIEIGSMGTMAAIPNSGVLGKYITKGQVKRIPISEGKAIFNDSIRIPIAPMIGVIGVAPEREGIPCGEPGFHGGNMDNTKIAAGSVLYLPVFHKGGLLALGDVHACMGDGEIMVTGVEIPAVVCLTVEVVKGKSIRTPMLETMDCCYVIASSEDIEEAIEIATYDMAGVLKEKLNMDLNEAGMLLSAIGHLEICQVVDPKRTVRVGVGTEYLTGLI